MANTNSEEIVYHHGTADPTDFQVDMLVCIAAGHGLQVGELYLANAVSRRKTSRRVVTTVTVSADFKLLEVLDAEAFLRRTRVVAEVMSSDGRVKTHSFANAEEFDVWCAFLRVAPNRIRNNHYVEAAPAPRGDCRFTAMCVPGELDDASDGEWYVYDLLFRTSDKVGDGPQSRSLAIWTAREANRVSWRAWSNVAVNLPALIPAFSKMVPMGPMHAHIAAILRDTTRTMIPRSSRARSGRRRRGWAALPSTVGCDHERRWPMSGRGSGLCRRCVSRKHSGLFDLLLFLRYIRAAPRRPLTEDVSGDRGK